MPIPALTIETPATTDNVVDFNSVRRQRALKQVRPAAILPAEPAQSPGVALVWPVWTPMAFYAACLMMVTPQQG